MLWRVVTKKTYPIRIIPWFVATGQTFVATKIVLVAAPANDKDALVATKHAFCLDKSMLVATKLLSRRTRVFRDKYLFCRNNHIHTFSATKDVFCRDYDSFCSEQTAIQQTTCSTVKWLLYNHLTVLQHVNQSWPPTFQTQKRFIKNADNDKHAKRFFGAKPLFSK